MAIEKKVFAAILLAILLFANGFLIGNLLSQTTSVNFNLEKPLSDTIIVSSKNAEAPSDILNLSDIEVNDEQIILRAQGARIASYANTGSMIPVLSEKANGIEIIPQFPEQIHAGDIITYEDSAGNSIIHRVIKIGQDEQGIYFVAKGDNSATNDGKIRFSQIKYLTIAIIY
jgi:hypothetical protein